MASTATPQDALSQYDLGRIKTPIGFYEELFRLHDLTVEHCIPAIVKKYDRNTEMVTVQPLVYCVSDTPSGEVEFSRPEYTVQVRSICCGGFSINIPMFVGDTGWLISCDRNAKDAREKNATQMLKDRTDEDDGGNEGEQKPNDSSSGGFEFGFFLPDYFGSHEFEDGDGLVISYTPADSTETKPIKINISKDGIAIKRKYAETEDNDAPNGEEVTISDDGVSVKRTFTNSDSESKSDTVSLTDDGLLYDGEPDREQAVVTDVRYDSSSHQFQKKTVTQKIRGDFVVETGEESDWVKIDGGQAVQVPE